MAEQKFKTIEEMWLVFWLAVGHKDAPQVQLIETRRAFYAGFHQCMTYQRVVIGSDDVSEDQGVAILESWEQEARRFAAEIAKGKA